MYATSRQTGFRLKLMASFVVIGLGFAFAVPAVAASVADETEPPLIVGLGDSFTSGVGTTGVDPDSGICRRGFDSYPLVAASTLGAKGQNAACSGATISAVTESFRGQRPQVERVADADAVVMTIGGNDVLSLGNATRALLDPRLVEQELANIEPLLNKAFTSVRAATPSDSPVLVLAYPNLFPTVASANCPALVQSALPRFQAAFDGLNTKISEQAKATGVTFVDTSKAFEGHDICSDDPWATGFEDWTVALHPNTAGHSALGNIVAENLQTLTANSETSPTAESDAPTPQLSSETAVLGAPKQQPDIEPASDEKMKHDSSHGSPAHPTHSDQSANDSDSSAPTGTSNEAKPKVVDEPAEQNEVASTTSNPGPQLAATGASSSLLATSGFGLVGIGLSMIWLQMRNRESLAS